MNYKNYSIFFEKYPNGLTLVTALGDEDEYIKLKFMYYTKREMIDAIKEEIDLRG